MAKIIIIGAGIAGLSAAIELANQQHHVQILEARPRIGGRIYTSRASDGSTTIELGASYWEGVNTSPFYLKYFSSSKVDLIKPYALMHEHSSSLIVNMDAFPKTILTTDEITKYYQIAAKILQDALQTAYGKTHCQLINDCNLSKWDPQARYWIKKIIEMQLIHQSTCFSKPGFPVFFIPKEDVLLNLYNEETANLCFVGNGYNRVISQLQKECEQANVNILTGSPVTLVTKNKKEMRVDTPQKQFRAHKIISTIPIGVLKKQAKCLFPALLSAEKLQAIASMGVHPSARIILEFQEPFWNKVEAPYILLSHSQHTAMKEFRSNYSLHGKAILQTPSYAKEAKQFCNARLLNHVMTDIREAFSNITVPEPILAKVYRWSEDPYAQGAYPYRTLQMDEKMHQALESREGNIYFAGADFSRHGFSVQHAYTVGRKVAQQLMQEL